MTEGSAAGHPARPASAVRQLGLLAFDIVVPIALYYLLRATGLSALTALALSAVPPAIGAAWQLAVRRHADPVALLVLGTVALSLIISVAVRSPQFLLAKDGLITGLWGLWFLASAVPGRAAGRRPAAFLFARPLLEGRRIFAPVPWDDLWQTQPRFRRIWRVSSVIWGAGLLADAVLRVVMAYVLPVDVVPGLGGALWPVTFVILQLVTNVYYQLAGLNRLLGAPSGRPRRRAGARTAAPGLEAPPGLEAGLEADLGAPPGPETDPEAAPVSAAARADSGSRPGRTPPAAG